MNFCKFYLELQRLKEIYKVLIEKNCVYININSLYHPKILKIKDSKVFRLFEHKKIYVSYDFIKKILKNEKKAMDIMLAIVLEEKYKVSEFLVTECLAVKNYRQYKEFESMINIGYFFYDVFVPNLKDKTFEDIENYITRLQSNKLDYANTILGKFVRGKEAKVFYEKLTNFLDMLKRIRKYPYSIFIIKLNELERYFLNFCEKRQDIIKFYRTLISIKYELRRLWRKYFSNYIIIDLYTFFVDIFQVLKKIKYEK